MTLFGNLRPVEAPDLAQFAPVDASPFVAEDAAAFELALLEETLPNPEMTFADATAPNDPGALEGTEATLEEDEAGVPNTLSVALAEQIQRWLAAAPKGEARPQAQTEPAPIPTLSPKLERAARQLADYLMALPNKRASETVAEQDAQRFPISAADRAVPVEAELDAQSLPEPDGAPDQPAISRAGAPTESASASQLADRPAFDQVANSILAQGKPEVPSDGSDAPRAPSLPSEGLAVPRGRAPTPAASVAPPAPAEPDPQSSSPASASPDDPAPRLAAANTLPRTLNPPGSPEPSSPESAPLSVAAPERVPAPPAPSARHEVGPKATRVTPEAAPNIEGRGSPSPAPAPTFEARLARAEPTADAVTSLPPEARPGSPQDSRLSFAPEREVPAPTIDGSMSRASSTKVTPQSRSESAAQAAPEPASITRGGDAPRSREAAPSRGPSPLPHGAAAEVAEPTKWREPKDLAEATAPVGPSHRSQAASPSPVDGPPTPTATSPAGKAPVSAGTPGPKVGPAPSAIPGPRPAGDPARGEPQTFTVGLSKDHTSVPRPPLDVATRMFSRPQPARGMKQEPMVQAAPIESAEVPQNFTSPFDFGQMAAAAAPLPRDPRSAPTAPPARVAPRAVEPITSPPSRLMAPAASSQDVRPTAAGPRDLPRSARPEAEAEVPAPSSRVPGRDPTTPSPKVVVGAHVDPNATPAAAVAVAVAVPSGFDPSLAPAEADLSGRDPVLVAVGPGPRTPVGQGEARPDGDPGEHHPSEPELEAIDGWRAEAEDPPIQGSDEAPPTRVNAAAPLGATPTTREAKEAPPNLSAPLQADLQTRPLDQPAAVAREPEAQVASQMRRLLAEVDRAVESRPHFQPLRLRFENEDGTPMRLLVSPGPGGQHKITVVVAHPQLRDELKRALPELSSAVSELPLDVSEIDITVDEVGSAHRPYNQHSRSILGGLG